MIIDFRTRPPFKSFMQGVLYEKPVEPVPETELVWSDIGKEPVVSAEERSIGLFVKEMEEAGIDRTVAMGRKADDYGAVDNDDIRELCTLYPGKFVPFAGYHPVTDTPDMLDDLAKAGFRGVCLDGGWLRQPLHYDAPVFEPVYERCEKLGLVLSLTASFFVGPDLGYSEPSPIMRIARKHPRLNIVIPHACWPHVTEAIAVAMICRNVFLCPDLYVHIDGVPRAEEYVQAANTMLRHQVVYASSYPVRSLAQSLAGWKKRGFDEDALRRTFSENALRLLGEK